MKNIIAVSVIIAVVFGVINLILIRKNNKDKQDEMLFNIVITNLDTAIQILETLDSDNANDSFSWAVATEQLSSFHNITRYINNKHLRKCYCGKLHSYILRIRNILDKVDDYKFFYGVRDYKNRSADNLLRESYINHTNISPNALGCITQFITLFHGARGDYMFNYGEINKILQPVYYGFKEDKEYTTEEIEKMTQPFKNIHRYIRERSIGVKELYQERQNNRDS